MRSETWSSGRDDGAVAVTVAIVLTVLLLFAALAVDLGLLRVDRASNQLAADLAVSAAIEEYEPRQSGSAREACLEAVAYAEANTGIDFEADGDGCEVFPEDAQCNDAATLRAQYTGEDDSGDAFSLVVSNPVFEDDPMMGSQPVTDIDGVACDRIGVTIERSRDYLFAGVAGFGSGEIQASAVGRGAGAGDAGEYASLVVLKEQAASNDCETLLSSSQNTVIEVDSLEREEIVDGDPVTVRYPGVITLDTTTPNGCQGQGTLISLNAGATIYADDHIFSHALHQGEDPSNVYDSGDVAADALSDEGLWPEPDAGRMVTRAPVDHRYNCLDTYPTGQNWSPVSSALSVTAPIDGCDVDEGPPPFLRALHSEYQTIDADDLPSDDWVVIPDEDDDELPDNCAQHDVEGTFGSADGAYAPDGSSGRYWFIDCPGTTGNTMFSLTDDFHFDGVDAVVAAGRVDADYQFGVTGRSGHGAILYLQNDRLTVGSSGGVDFENTFVYVDNGEVRISAQAQLSWYGPLHESDEHPGDIPTGACDAYEGDPDGAPPAGCFVPLALWSNSDDWHRLGGGGGLDIGGSFFTPNAQAFRLRGDGDQHLDKAQFFTAELDAGGQGTVTMIPNPDTNIEVPLTGSALLR